ncbi:hypothetical protein [Streptomyces buecherae]|uniref:hypothetical protein n=1 Tax=Streptomyces buecherae TaxID=2763006 RepID=UPI001C261675|nr:hypothetical protein [Streptomyces buecherae]
MNKSDLAVPEDGLPGLASDLSEMQSYLATQAKRMATIVDAIESGWRSPAASTYAEFQQSVARDLPRGTGSRPGIRRAIPERVQEGTQVDRSGDVTNTQPMGIKCQTKSFPSFSASPAHATSLPA